MDRARIAVGRLPKRSAPEALRAPVTTRIRHEIWVKLLGNIAFNPISVLTGATMIEMVRHPDVSMLAREIMREAEAVANASRHRAAHLDRSADGGCREGGAHKTSMLQDLEAGRPMELEAVVGSVLEVAERLGVQTPATRAVYACTKLLDQQRTELHTLPVPEVTR